MLKKLIEKKKVLEIVISKFPASVTEVSNVCCISYLVSEQLSVAYVSDILVLSFSEICNID